MKEYRYAIILHPEPEAGGFSVDVPALPGCYAQGESLEEAIAAAREAIAVHIQGLVEEGLPIPLEDEHPQVVVVEVAA